MISGVGWQTPPPTGGIAIIAREKAAVETPETIAGNIYFLLRGGLLASVRGASGESPSIGNGA